MRKFYLLLLLPLIGQIGRVAAQTTPLFDSGATTIIGGNSGPYNNVVNINASSGTETFYFAVGTGNGSNNAPWTSGNTVTALNLSLWGFSPSGSAVPVTVGLYTGTDTGTGLSGLTAIGSTVPQTQNVNNTTGGNYNNTASIFSFGLTGAAQTTNPITPNSELIVGVTISTGNAFDLATGPLVGSPQPNYTFSNAFTGSTGLDTNSYFYTAGNGTVSGAVLSQDVGLATFADLTATVTPVPEPPLEHYLLLSLPLLISITLVRRRRLHAAN